MASPRSSVRVERTSTGRYRATNARGTTVELGDAEDLFSPVEMLLAAIAACSAVDVDVVTARRAEPDRFVVTASAQKSSEGGNHLTDVEVAFDVSFDASPAGREAERLVPRLVQLSHDRDCTVSRTVELPTAVHSTVTGS